MNRLHSHLSNHRSFSVLFSLPLILCSLLLPSCDGILPHSPDTTPQIVQKPPMFPETGSEPSGNFSRWTGSEGTWYQIFTIAFYDSNGDGKGDIMGIINKLDYLNDSSSPGHAQRMAANGECTNSLHIDGIWLTPIMKANSYHKYDTTDYYLVDPEFGSNADVADLKNACEERGVKLIVDLAVNHTSPNHPWFPLAINEWKSGNMGRYSSYYNIRIGSNYNGWENNFGISGHWFRPSQSIWLDEAKASWNNNDYIFYYGAFNEWMPDLNWESNAVMQEFDAIVKYWLHKDSMNLDGFRLDATKHIFELAEWTGDQERNIAYWTWFAQMARKHKPDAYMVGECLGGDDEILEYHRPGMSSFALFMANEWGRIKNAVLDGNGRNFADGVKWYAREVKNRHPLATFSPFLSNHDFDRSSNWLKDHDQRKMAAALLLLCPGTPFMYYGEELGIVGYKVPDDRMVRGPMLFSGDTTGRPFPGATYPGSGPLQMGYCEWPQSGWDNGQGLPSYSDFGFGVDEQIANDRSLLRYYIKIQNMKNKYPWIAWGAISDDGIDVDMQGIIAAYRITDDKPGSPTFGKSVVIAHNTVGGNPDSAHGYIKVPKAKGYEASSALYNPIAEENIVIDGNEPGVYWLTPFATAIFREY